MFNRRPQAEEVKILQSRETLQALSEAGYSHVSLRVSDRRLEIAGTSLDELEAGLAGFLASHLASVTAHIQADRAAAQASMAAAVEAEGVRADAIARQAERIVFTPTPTPG